PAITDTVDPGWRREGVVSGTAWRPYSVLFPAGAPTPAPRQGRGPAPSAPVSSPINRPERALLGLAVEGAVLVGALDPPGDEKALGPLRLGVAVDERPELGVVAGHGDVGQLVDDHVVEDPRGLLGQAGRDADGALPRGARPPPPLLCVRPADGRWQRQLVAGGQAPGPAGEVAGAAVALALDAPRHL